MKRRAKIELALGALMFLAGAVGAVLSALGVIAQDEPPVVLQLSWAALWMSGITAMVAADR